MSTVPNPYRRADFHAAGRVLAGWSGFFWRIAPVVAAVCAVIILRHSVFAFTAAPVERWAGSAVGVVGRVAVALVAGMALYGYDLVVRSPDRGLIDAHPLLARAYVAARIHSALRGALPALVAALVVVGPVAAHLPLALALGVVLVGAWLAGLAVSLGVNLAAPALGANPALGPMLDAVRGQNPRAQAALVWAPGAALMLGGLAVLAALAGVAPALAGEVGGLALLVPYAAAAVGFRLAFVHEDTLARIPAVLGEVESAYASVERAEEGRAVYLDWIVPRLPAALRLDTLRVLRHGWRGERTWLSASFGAALLAGLASWAEPAGELQRATLVAAVGVAAVGLLGPRLRGQDPAWLDLVLPRAGVRAAHVLALLAWMQPVVIAAVAAMAARHGPGPAAELGLRVELVGAFAALMGARVPMGMYVPAVMVGLAVGVWS